jgi:hypothetical protein
LTNWWKAYSRFSILVGFSLAILAAVGVSALVRRRRGRYIVYVTFAALAIELLPGAPVPTWDVHAAPSTPLARWLSTQPRGIVAHYPMVQSWLPTYRSAEDWSSHTWQTVYDQTLHRQPLFALPSLPMTGPMTGSREEAIRLLAMDLERPETAPLLAAESVRYVVVNDAMYRQLDMNPPRLPSGYRELAVVDGNRIFRVTSPPGDLRELLSDGAATIVEARGLENPSVAFGAGFLDPESYFGTPARWMTHDGVLSIRAPRLPEPALYGVVLQTFSNRVPRRVELIDELGAVRGRTIVGVSNERHVLGPLLLNGPTTFRLRATPGPVRLSSTDPRIGSIYVITAQVEFIPD